MINHVRTHSSYFIVVMTAFTLFFAHAGAKACGGDQPIVFKVNRFLGYGEPANRVRPLFEAVRLPQSIPSDNVVSRRGIKVGRYLFVYLEDQGRGEWRRYRQEDDGRYREFVTKENSIRVTTDEQIFVKKEDGRELSIRRNNVDERYQPEIRVRVSHDRIEVIDRRRSEASVIAQANLGSEEVSSVSEVSMDLNSSTQPVPRINCANPPEDSPIYIRRPLEPFYQPHQRSSGRQ